MTYQQHNQQKQMAKALIAKTVSYDTNGLYVRRKLWNGMNWIGRGKRLSIYLRDNLQCVYCGKTIFDNIRLTLDHVKPIDKYKGSHTDTKNIVTCCSNCNFSKQDLTLTKFAKMKAEELNTPYLTIIQNVRNALKRKTDTKQAGIIVRAQRNWQNIFTHFKTK